MKKNPLLPVALIVTSDPATAAYLRNLLQLGFQLIERDDLSSAQELVRTAGVDLILLDSKGVEEEVLFQALSQCRTMLGKKKTPLLVMTDNLKKAFALNALRAGATDFINYPLDESEIEQRIVVAFQSFEKTKNVTEVAKRSAPHTPATAPSLVGREILNDQAIKALSQARQSAGYVSLLIIELDTGKKTPSCSLDEVAVQLISALQSQLRKHDILIPQNRGKFVLMLPKTSQRAAELIAEAIRTDIEQKIPPFSVSIGLITWDHSRPIYGSAAEEFDHLITVATQAVSEAKKTGNRIITSHPV